MLTLVRRLSADLGISVIMSSHLLEDVVRTCDSVIVLREGQVVAQQRLAPEPGDRRGDMQVRLDGAADGFVEAARRLGLTVEVTPDWLLVQGGNEETVLRGVRDAACESGTGLRELRPAGPTLEESLIAEIG